MPQVDNKRRNYRRTIVRCSAFAAAVAFLVPLLPWTSVPVVVPALSPFVLIVASIATRSVGLVTLIGLPVLIAILIWRRWFCRWLCPVGLLRDGVARLSPVSGISCRRVPTLGKGLAFAALAAAVAGYPMLLWLDPVAIFAGAFGLLHDPIEPAGWVAAAALIGLLLLSALSPGIWCLKICPLGATQELLAVPSRMLSAGRRKSTPAACTLETEFDTTPLPRRSLFAMAAGTACVGLGAWLGVTTRARADSRRSSSLRPPGAAPPWLFGQLCIRCGNCARACPADIIHARWESDSIADWLTPVVSIEDDYCREDCNACMQVCPSGAIRRGNLEDKLQQLIGLAHVDMDRCLLALNQECRTMCVESCPYDAIEAVWSWEEGAKYPIVDPEKCPGCGACVLACTPMDAIRILPPGIKPVDLGASDGVQGEIDEEAAEDDPSNDTDDWMTEESESIG